MTSVLAEVGNRAWVMIFTDTNDQFGKQRRRGGHTQAAEPDRHVGELNGGLEHYTAKRLRTFLQIHELAVLSSHISPGPATYYGPSGQRSLIDHAIIPCDLAGRVRAYTVLRREMQKLQVIPDRRPRDHSPVWLHIDMKLETVSLPTGPRFSREKRFIEEVEKNLAGTTEAEIEKMEKNKTPDELWETILTAREGREGRSAQDGQPTPMTQAAAGRPQTPGALGRMISGYFAEANAE